MHPLTPLVARAAAGDRQAEAVLCGHLAPVVRTFARRRVRVPDLVDELTQDVLLVFLEALREGGIKEPAQVGSFVLGICRNLVRDRVRATERRAELWQAFGPALAAEEGGSERVVYELAHLEDCVSQLGQRARDVIRLSYLAPTETVDIARALDTSDVNVRVLRHRTLQALRVCLSGRISWEVS
ncbi:MAG TPA: sigma-70 family RNA polymerase sigma factor [Polyangia bacterium]